jgi:hypothetical protein
VNTLHKGGGGGGGDGDDGVIDVGYPLWCIRSQCVFIRLPMTHNKKLTVNVFWPLQL